ncbi:hypothetical protein SPRG_15947 [Saprolegnia parasitica CBS 223.65]|uniref:Uncharacterized protein n=1 Tax=Saprolegnia parasitica (strain CBS 223.65) TaxID=695850 RepID=A0A067BJZ1_SAPPC|nr:hypothetical protein SPRG_15947 [Saprolegnia parasitica CBS 223.65]KDO18759.1 hypothetical protein SPRG_15947 [Saprolegnia parasitica CBS 223.65]|eukprot:XP_012210537.1 hypothetical protein SPRG_15947 [Saprolegnia parasitica CBS 223.65]
MEYTVRMPMLPIDDRLPGNMPPDDTIWSSIDDAWTSMAIWVLMVFQSTKNESMETMRSHLHRAKHLYENAALDSLESCRLLGPLLQHAVHADDDVKHATSSSLLLRALDEATSLTRLDTVLEHLLATLQLERGRRQLSMAQRRTSAKNAVVALSATAVISRVEAAPMAATCGVLLSASVAIEAALEGAIHAVQTEMRLFSDLRVSAQLTRHWLLVSSSLLFDIQAMTLEQQCRHVLAHFAKGDD